MQPRPLKLGRPRRAPVFTDEGQAAVNWMSVHISHTCTPGMAQATCTTAAHSHRPPRACLRVTVSVFFFFSLMFILILINTNEPMIK